MQKARHKKRYYYQQLGAFRTELRKAIPHSTLRELHRCIAWKHFAVVVRQLVLAGLAIFGILHYPALWIWLPCSIVLGFVIFDFTVLLHEVVHNTVFARKRPGLNALLGWFYALPSGISKTQFTRWHLDHHDELGSSSDDPKRAHLTPKIVTRWYKLLYMTPVLFFLYFRAAACEARDYPGTLRQIVKRERSITMTIHLLAMIAILLSGGMGVFFKVYAIPYFFVFPVAFTINRMGQHYNIDPTDIAQWSTLMKGSWFWDFVYLNSNYHLEHHYFPAIPFYNLPKVQKLLQPLYERHGMKERTYQQILYGWFIQNQIPHTHWDSTNPVEPSSPSAGIEPASTLE